MNRIRSIDIMRGLTLFLMLFVNDLYVPGVPRWLVHTEASFDGMGLADWVFPGFLFMVGMSIPFAVSARRKKGHSDRQILQHILVRSVSLILIGIMMVNISRYDPALSGINKFAWTIAMYVSFFLIWNDYPDQRTLFKAMRIFGILLLLSLALIFRSGSAESAQWLITSWWGILGLIGWGYLAIATIYIYTGDRILPVVAIHLFFLALNIISSMDLIPWPPFINKFIGVLLSGNVPLLVSAGLLSGILVKI